VYKKSSKHGNGTPFCKTETEFSFFFMANSHEEKRLKQGIGYALFQSNPGAMSRHIFYFS
jgi:hypothetical protein